MFTLPTLSNFKHTDVKTIPLLGMMHACTSNAQTARTVFNNLKSRIALLLLLGSLLFSAGLRASDACMQVPIAMADRVAHADLIVEGEVIDTRSSWNLQRNMIFTVSQVRVYKVFKGVTTVTDLDIITEGGRDGLDWIESTNEWKPVVGEQGIFLLRASSRIPDLPLRIRQQVYYCFMATQSIIDYDLVGKTANTPFIGFANIPVDLYGVLHRLTGRYHTEISANTRLNQALSSSGGNQVAAVPTITSFTPTTITAGTRSLLTINGTNFGATRGTGYVEFRNANDGGASWVQAKATDYRTWTNSQITVWVPSSSLSSGPSAGTGQIRVTNSDPNSVTSAGTLTVTYSVINVEFDGKGQYTEHLNDNGSGGYTFQCESGTFATNTSAVAAFTRAMNTWTCSTNMNWVLGANTTVDTVLADGVNIVRFDKGPSLPTGVLGRATSRFSGCINSGAAPFDTVWTVTEIDVAFDDAAAGLAWNFTTANATLSQVDFESVAVHELGHAHQLQHIINSGAIMHYSISNGQTSRVLSPTIDVPAGTFVMTRSTAAHGACKTSPMTALSLAASVSIAASPGTSICSNTSVTFTATPVLPAGTATYTWKKNGVTVGANSPTYTNASWVNGDQVQVVMTVSGGCNQTVNSNTLTMTVTPSVAASVSIAASPGTTICSGTNVTFTATPTNGGTTPSYQWKLNGVNVGSNSPTYSNNALVNGNTVSCVMTSNASCVTGSPATSNTLTMSVTATPTVSISPATVTICSGQSTTLTATGATSYSWSPGGATTGAITVSPGATTTYTVTGTTGSCTASATRLVTVNATPTVSISPASTTICAGQSTTLTASGASTYAWTPGGATTAAITVSPGSTTTYTVVGTTGSCTASATRLVTVNAVPGVSISPPAPTICSGSSVTLTASGAVSYQWPPSTFTASITVSPTTNTQYTVIGTNASGCSATASALVTVTQVPIAVSPASASICSGQNTTLTASGATSYSWSPGGATTAAITVAPTSTTTYTVTGTVSGCTKTATATVNVTTVNITISPSTASICPGGSVTLTASGGTTYLWAPGGATTAAVTVSPASTTTYTVTSSSGGCPGSATRLVTVNPSVTAGINIAPTPGNSICSGTSVLFTATVSNGGASPFYQWTRNGSTVGTNANTFSTSLLNNGDIISCTLTSNATCVTNPTVVSNPVTMTVSGGLPTISSFTPTTGPSGTSVTISGTNFVGVSAVKFNGTNAAFTVNSSTQITATVPAGATTGLISVTNNCGTGNSSGNFTIGTANANLLLQVLLQGFYIGGGQMIPVNSPSLNPLSCDTITVSLASASAPYNILYSNKDTISVSGIGVFTFPGAVVGSSYYIVVNHRNSLETWSATPVAFSSSGISYNFQNSAAQAFGSNQANLGGGKFGLYSGDTNQDDLVEATDFSDVENGVQAFLFGYVVTDLNGDGLVEASDYSLVENNSLLFLFSATP